MLGPMHKVPNAAHPEGPYPLPTVYRSDMDVLGKYT